MYKSFLFPIKYKILHNILLQNKNKIVPVYLLKTVVLFTKLCGSQKTKLKS